MAKADNKAKNAKTFDDESFFEALTLEEKSLESDESTSPSSYFQKSIEEEKNIQAESKEEKNTGESGINWEQRYNDSTKGVEKLKDENVELKRKMEKSETLMPIVELIESKPELLEMVRNYVEEGGITPQSIKDELNLSDDFVPDIEDVFKNPDSESARAFNHMVSKAANEIVTENLNKFQEDKDKKDMIEKRRDTFEAEKEALIKKYNLTDDDFKEIMNYANDEKWSLEKIYKLKNLDSRDKNIIKNLERDKTNQRKRMRDYPASVKSATMSDTDKNDEDFIFDAIKRSLNRGNVFYQKD